MLVSICIPVFNGATWLRQAMESALGQSRGDFELVVVENGSTDETLAIARTVAQDDERVRVEHFAETVDAVANHNRCLALAKGRLIKFLHHDDALRADCVERMAAVLEQEPSVGLVFSRRDLVLEEPDEPAAQAWARTYAALHDGFGPLEPINRGGELLDRWLPTFGDADFENWVAEPSATMLRRDTVERVGGFNGRVRQAFDIDLWLRLMAVSDVGYVDEPLVTFRHHTQSLTAETAADRRDWLDRLWLFESLLASPGFEARRRMLRSFRRRELLRVARRQLGRLVRGDRDLRPLSTYLRYRLAGR